MHFGFEIVPNREVLRSILTRNTYFLAKKSDWANQNLVYPENLVQLSQHLQGNHSGLFGGEGMPEFKLSFEEDLKVSVRGAHARISSQVHCFLESETSTTEPMSLRFSEFPHFRRFGGSKFLASSLDLLSELKEVAVTLESGRAKIFTFLSSK
jgi:hypothetical protein